MTVNILQIFPKAVTVCEVSLQQNTACNQRTLRGDMACCKKCYQATLFYLKGKVHSKRKRLSSFTHSCVSPKHWIIFLQKELKRQYFEKIKVCPYNFQLPVFFKIYLPHKKEMHTSLELLDPLVQGQILPKKVIIIIKQLNDRHICQYSDKHCISPSSYKLDDILMHMPVP